MSDNPKELTTKFKRSGAFDQQRKILLQNFRELETHANLLLKLKLLIESKVKDDPSILMKNKGKMAALIQGEIINQHHAESKNSARRGLNGPPAPPSLLSIVDKDIKDKIVDLSEFDDLLTNEIRDIQRKLMGISDEDYQAQLQQEKEEAERKAREEAEQRERRRREWQDMERAKEKMWEEKALRNKPPGVSQHHRVSKPRINIRVGKDSYTPSREKDSYTPLKDSYTPLKDSTTPKDAPSSKDKEVDTNHSSAYRARDAYKEERPEKKLEKPNFMMY